MKGKRIFTRLIALMTLALVLGATISMSALTATAAEVNIPATDIKIDGNFEDWSCIAKTENYSYFLPEVAMVWVDDYLYLYFKENSNEYDGNIIHSTPWHNGNFTIRTDLGTTRSIFVNREGVWYDKQKGEAIESKASNHQYELKIPISKISRGDKASYFDLLVTNASEDRANLVNQVIKISTTEEDLGEDQPTIDIRPQAVTIDGDYSDWENYPVTIVQYSTGGGNGNDAFASLYSDGTKVYGYLEYYKNSKFYSDELQYFKIKINDGDNKELGLTANPKIATNIPGLYCVDIIGTANKAKYGYAYIKIDATGRKFIEYYLDLDMVANYYKVQKSDIKTISAYYDRIGNQWVTCAGTSTGPIVGVLTCIIVAGVGIIIYELERRKKKTINQEG